MSEEPITCVNYYECPKCGCRWQSAWSCNCNDKCPKCNAEITPYHTEWIDQPLSPDELTAGMNVTPDYKPLIEVCAPGFFLDPLFMKWLKDPDTRVATWHRGVEPDDWSDIFMTVETPELGSNSNMPEHCWRVLMKALVDAGIPDGTEALLWLKNM